MNGTQIRHGTFGESNAYWLKFRLAVTQEQRNNVRFPETNFHFPSGNIA